VSADWLWAAAAAWALAVVLALGATRNLLLWATGALSGGGGVAAVVGGILVALSGHRTAAVIGSRGPVGQLVLRVSPLAATFIVLLGVIAFAIGCSTPRLHRAGAGTAIYLSVLNLALLASLSVLVAGSVTVFLVSWESMTLTSSLLVLRNHRRQGVADAAFLFLALGEVGFMMIVAAFVLLAIHAHSFDLVVLASRVHTMPAGTRNAVFVLALLGFGFKVGLVPFHIWLPVAHPAAPADGSAFLSGMVIKLGIYGIALFGFELLGRGPPWWGVLTMALGAISALLGILYALMERDLKRFLAYSTIENGGIIVTALGAALMFSSYGRFTLSAFLLLAALYHVLNHGVYKTALFLEAGVIDHATRTRDLDRLGGLVHRLKRSAVVTLVATLGIAALPPLNGFVSEWLIFQGLFQGFRIPSHLAGVLIVLAAATLGLTSGLAIMAFARMFGIAFLGMPRSPRASNASEAGQPVLGPVFLAAGCVGLAIGAPAVLVAFDRVVRAVTGVQLRSVLLVGNLTVIPAHTDFSAFSPTYLAACLAAMAAVPLLIYLAGRPRGSTRRVPVWDNGIVSFKPRMQYTATTYSNPVRVTFDRLYDPEIHVDRASDDPAGRSGPVHYRMKVRPIFEQFLYQPVIRLVQGIARILQPIQSGNVNVYLLYILVVVIIVYFAAAA
jgi:hydrogenase-4 component B